MDENGREEESLPNDLIINVLKRVPVKSLIQLKCVSKNWKKIIESPNFTSQHLSHSSSNNINASLLLERITRSLPLTSSLCLIEPDLTVHRLQSVSTAAAATIVGSCNGLLLIQDAKSYNLSLWNPATRQLRQVSETLINKSNAFNWIGFGFCPIVNDYKIVRIFPHQLKFDEDLVFYPGHCKVNRAQFYSLTNGFWKEINVVNLQNLALVSSSRVNYNGSIFFEATTMTSRYSDSELVLSFDIEQEVFNLLQGPPPPPCIESCFYSNVVAVYNNKLAVLRKFIMGNSCCIDLWVQENSNVCAGMEGWVKKYSVGSFPRTLSPICIWRDEIVCRPSRLQPQIDGSDAVETIISLFDPYSNQVTPLPAQRDDIYYEIFHYAESLVPVDCVHHD